MFSQDLGLWGMISNSGFVVLLVLIILLLFSVICWAIILLKSRQIRRAVKESVAFNDFFWKSGDLSDAYVRSKQFNHSPIALGFSHRLSGAAQGDQEQRLQACQWW